MRIIRVFAPVIVMMFSAGLAYAGGGTALTYQGRLLDAGEPANGTFNVDFSLWDHSAGGIQIGSTISFISLPISDGLFTVQLDFGANAFNNTDRWLEIVVDGVPLAPRQSITRAPYAIQTRGIFVDDNQLVEMGVTPGQQRLRVWNFAGGGAFEAVSSNRAIEAISTEGDMAILASNQSANGMGVFAQHQPSQNQAWLGTPDYGVYGRANDVGNDWAGYFLGRAHVSDRLFVGREDPIISTEYFGFHAPVGDGQFGGMYISTNGQSAKPFYGYAAGGNIDMWHYYDGATGNWHLFNGGEERLTVQSNGNVGIGTTAPDYALHVVVSAGDRAIFGENTLTSGFRYGVWGQNNSTSGGGVFGFATATSGIANGVLGWSDSTTGTGVRGAALASSGFNIGVYGTTNSPDGYGVYSVGNVCTTGSYLNCSDARFKENVQPLADSLDKILKLRGVQFDWKRDEFPEHNFSQDRQVGFIAQEVAEVLPDLVAGGDGEDEFYSVSYGRLVPILVEAIKELNGEAQHKDSQITELQARLTALETLVERLDLDRNGGAK